MKIRLILIVCILVIFTACSGSNDSDSARKRRSVVKETTTSSKTDETNKPTLPTVAPSDTKPIVAKPFLKASQIKEQWPEARLCALVSTDQAKEVLAMTTAPTPQYSFIEEIGADCQWDSGDGDNAYIELSTQSYKTARDIDASLNANGTPLIISGVAGVIKSNSLGSFVELNVWGENSNQWVANAPSEQAAKKLAEYLIAGLSK